MGNHSYENDFHENETACRTHFHMKGFALRLALKQRHKGTRKWPIWPKFIQKTTPVNGKRALKYVHVTFKTSIKTTLSTTTKA